MNIEPMRELPVPKFKIGDKVWAHRIINADEIIQCPDCLGSGKWNVKSPAGYEAQVECPRCSGSRNLRMFSLGKNVELLTIGSIRINTANRDGEYISYMCDETGIESGSLYEESLLSDSKENANQAVEVELAARLLALENGSQKQARNEFRHLSKYQLTTAELKKAESVAWNAQYDKRSLLTRIAELKADTILYSNEKFVDTVGRPEAMPNYVQLEMSIEMVTLLQEHLMGYEDESISWLIQHRAEQKECHCP